MWGFIGWSVIAFALVVIGIVSWNSKKPAGFFAGVKAEVNDIKKYIIHTRFKKRIVLNIINRFNF